MNKILDIFAAIGLAFNVDWDNEYEDDDYVVALRHNMAEETPTVIRTSGVAVSRAV